MSVALVTGGTKKDVDAMAVLALNVQEKCPHLADELVIYHDGIRKEDQEKMNEIMPTTFIRYRCPINWFRLMANRTIRYFSPMVFCKYECLHLLSKYEKVIWTDYDILIKENIDELRDLESGLTVIVNHEVPLRDMFYKTIEKADTTTFDLDGESICMPLFILTREIGDYEFYYEWCYEMTKKYLRHLYLPEQCILTMMTQIFEIPFQEIPKPIYCMHPREEVEKTKILHAYGQPKFWDGLENAEWSRYFEQWKKRKER